MTTSIKGESLLQKKARLSNFELLRIVAMLGIVIYHLVLHHIDYNRFALDLPEVGPQFGHLEVIQVFYSLGQIGNTLFILITGYFLIEKPVVNLQRPGIKLLNRSYMAALILLGIAYLGSRYQLPFSSESNPNMALTGWWFVGYYLFVIILAKFVLNDFLQKLSKRDYLTFIFVLVLLLSFFEVFKVLQNLKIENLVIGIVVYAIGGFIKLYNPFQGLRLLTIFLVIASFILIQVIEFKVNYSVLLRIFHSNPPRVSHFSETPFVNVLWSLSVIYLIVSLAIFELFRRLPLRNCWVINQLSSATFTVYLFHESFFFRQLYLKGLPLPNQVGLLSQASTKVVKKGEPGGEFQKLVDPDNWLPLSDFLNISQVFQERGTLVGVSYILILALVIFVIGVILDVIIRLVNRGIQCLFYRDFEQLKKQIL